MLTQNDAPASGEHRISVSLWSTADGGTPIWNDDFQTIVTQGVFNVALGSGKLLPLTLDGATWLSVSIDGGPPAARSRLTVVPYALSSGTLSTDYVSSISVNGERLTGRAKDINIVTGDGIGATLDPTTSSIMFALQKATGGKGAKSESVIENPCGSNDYGGQLGDLVVGGCGNQIWEAGGHEPFDYCVIVGGQNNLITNQIAGNPLDEGTWYHFIGGGKFNRIMAEIDAAHQNEWMGESVIAGGDSNTVVAPYSIIGGGMRNIISSQWPPVDNDRGDKMLYDVIVGGDSNRVVLNSLASIIGGGRHNAIRSIDTNTTANVSVIGGGDTNVISADFSFIGGGKANLIADASTTANHSAVAGGESNTVSADHSAIAGGQDNTVSSDHSVIGGGIHNRALAGMSMVIGGGDTNTVSGTLSTIAGGAQNIALETYAFIGGGQSNVDSSDHSVIAGGHANKIGGAADHSMIGGGRFNYVGSPASVIGGGDSNIIDVSTANYPLGDNAILGGSRNWIRIETGSPKTFYTTIAGGHLDTAHEYAAFVGGGERNNADEEFSSVVGGQDNKVYSPYTIVAGGDGNQVGLNGNESGIFSGRLNFVTALASAIVSGRGNIIQDAGLLEAQRGSYSFIGGGDTNVINTRFSVIGGGQFNYVSTYADHTAIGGGESNIVYEAADHSFVGGGENNQAEAFFATIGGGGGTYASGGGGESATLLTSSTISLPLQGNQAIAPYTTIGGGGSNIAADTLTSVLGGAANNAWLLGSSIGGGWNNTTLGQFSTIPGGEGLTTQAYGQIAVGYANVPTGTFTRGTTHVFAPGGPQDEPLFIIGNGDSWPGSTSNAYEVSYDGHSRVTDVEGSGGATPGPPQRAAVYGATYVDNIIYAWADVPKGGIPSKTIPVPTVLANADFGVKKIEHPSNGVYVVTLNTGTASSGANIDLSHASITVTLVGNDTTDLGPQFTWDSDHNVPRLVRGGTVLNPADCGYASASQIGILQGAAFASTFIIRTYAHNITSCEPSDHAFFFKVTGRQ